MASLLKPVIILIILNLIIFFSCAVSSSNPKKPSPKCHKPSPKCPKPAPPSPRPSLPRLRPSPPGPKQRKCPRNAIKFFVCGKWLEVAKVKAGTPPSHKCCSLLKGMIDLEAAVCLCTAIRARVFGVFNIRIPVAISMVATSCKKNLPTGFDC